MNHLLPIALMALLAPCGALPSQAPKGQLIASCFNIAEPSPLNGQPGGLFVVHPRTPAPPIQVQGLPLQMTGQNIVGSSCSVGCSGIVALPNGDLLVGEVTPPAGCIAGVNANLEVHCVRLTPTPGMPNPGGWSAQVTNSYTIATLGTNNGEVTDLELLANGSVLVSYHVGSWQPHLGILDPATGAWTPAAAVGGFPPGSVISALAVGSNGQTAYLGEYNPAQTGEVWALPLPLGSGPATPLTAMGTAGSVHAIDRDSQGNLLVGKWAQPPGGGFSGTVHLGVDVLTGAVTNLLPGSTIVPNAVLVERNTDDFFTGGIWHVPPGAPASMIRLVNSGPGGATGVVAGFAMMPAVDAFGSSSTCAPQQSYTWQTAPNPGGIPLVGNAGFSITVAAPSPQASCVFGLSLGRAAAPVPLPSCAQLLLNPAFLASGGFVGSTGAGTTFTLPLAVPNNAGLAGLSLFAQSFHLVSTAPVLIDSSPGLCVTIL